MQERLVSGDGDLLIGRGYEILTTPCSEWKEALSSAPEVNAERFRFMSQDHHRVRYYAVEELPRSGAPLSAARIGSVLGLPEEKVGEILGDLERHLFFLVRDQAGEVSWAFPVTVDRTPHRLTFSTGERLHGA